ncbi:hypothetical protein D3C75_771990 [compost metagenome]
MFHLADGQPHVFCSSVCFLKAFVGEDDRELLPAIPGSKIVQADQPRYLSRHLLEHKIADPVSVSVIHPLEIIDIKKRQLQTQPVALTLLQERIQVFMEGFMIIEPGKCVDFQKLVRDRPLHHEPLL